MELPKRHRLFPCGQRFLFDEGGAAAALLAVVFPVMIGGMALGAEVGFWFLSQRQLQQAADLAAHAAAVGKRSGAGESEMKEAALRVADGSGFDEGTDALTLLTPPQAGDYVGQADSVEIRIERQQERYLTRVYASDSVRLTARAVASVESGATACVLALSASAPRAIEVSGSADVTFAGCDIASNSNASDSFLMSGSGSVLSTGCVNTVGAAVATAGLTLTDCAAINENAPAAADPYSDIAEPALTGTCRGGNVGSTSQATVLTPSEIHASGVPSMRFCSGLSVSGDVTFEPGLYLVEGGRFRINSNAVVAGSGVTFYLADGVEMSFNGSAQFNFSAPDSGPYSGLLVFGSHSANAMQHTMNGTSNSVLDGAVYTPASHLDFTGDFTEETGGCTQLIAGTVLFSGNSTLQVDCQASGTRPVEVRQEVRLVE